MIASHIHDALDQVRKVQTYVLGRKNFTGYSGIARILGGCMALSGTVILYYCNIPPKPVYHLIGWGIVLTMSLILNYGALLFWFLFNEEVHGDFFKILPAIDAVPSFAIGAIFSLAMIVQGQYQFLFGIWMSFYGLGHLSHRLNLPHSNYILGIYYIVCGAICLFDPISFINPWPMGLIFFFGELMGGIIFYRNKLDARYAKRINVA